ncbi:MAG: RluA family pseudouridine synthase [Nitrospira sp.]|nr:RluA family pseudouridine synthase [Nitrospira sp.]
MNEWIVTSKDVRLRLDLYLLKKGLSLSRSRVQRLIQDGHITVKGQKVKPNYRVHLDDKVSIDLPLPTPLEIKPEAIPLEIVYEDAHLLVVNKPAGMVVHPAPGNFAGTLVHALLHHCRDLSGIGGKERPGLVHRLDKETSGLLVVAKTEQAHRALAAQFKAHTVTRCYLTLVHGIPKAHRGIIEVAIGRDLRDRKKISPRTTRPRSAVTQYEVLERYGEFSLLAVRPQTGRTHQIRVHLSHLGHPVMGDKVYGLGKKMDFENELWIRRQMLHAQQLGFDHPGTGQRMEFLAPFPLDMERIISWLKNMQTP